MSPGLPMQYWIRHGVILLFGLTMYLATTVTVACADERLVVPDKDARRESLALIKSVYGDDYKSAKTPTTLMAFAKKLLNDAARLEDDPTGRYCMMQVARDVSARGGIAETTVTAIDSMANEYQIDAIEAKRFALIEVNRNAKTNELRRSLSLHALRASREAYGEQRFDQSLALAQISEKAAIASRNTSVVKTSRDQIRQARLGVTEFAKVKKALATLEQTPTDAAANRVAGVFYCLDRGDWEKGLSMLALSDVEQLSAMAKRETALDTDAAAATIIVVADGWWDLSLELAGSDDYTELQAKQMQRHAGEWYRKVEDSLSGLNKIRIGRVLKQLDDEAAALAAKNKEPADKPKKPDKSEVGWVDVLKLVDPQKDSVQGNWARRGSIIYTPVKSSLARIAVPVTPKESYELRVEFIRNSGQDSVVFMLPVGQHYGMVQLSGWGGQFGGLNLLNRRKPNEKANPTSRPSPLNNGGKYVLLTRVQLLPGDNVDITTTLNGQPFLRWKGPSSALSEDTFWSMKGRRTLGIGSNRSILTVYSMQIRKI